MKSKEREMNQSEYQKPKTTIFELEGQPMMVDTSEIGIGGQGDGDANGRRKPFGTSFGGNTFGNP